MTSKIVAELLDRAELTPLLAAREQGNVPAASPEVTELLSRADILALGAAADAARRRECGDDARIFVPRPPVPSASIVVLGAEERARGTALLRRVATMRLLGPVALSIVIDFGALGLEVAQVALSFGATDLAGPIASRRGLPVLAEDQKKLLKKRELAAYVERAGFRAVFVTSEGPGASTDAPPFLPTSRDHVES